jgi:exopolyphosphatase / guanosine-5'-triphosphate,3'-diphosphate pyrophosphatase
MRSRGMAGWPDEARARQRPGRRRDPARAALCYAGRRMNDGTLLAGVDLGSNSFRLEIGRLDHGQVRRVEYLKETVRLGAGFDESRNLTRGAMQRGWDCLARFGERLAGFRRGQVRAVATQTLREARNRDEFLGRAREVLGFPIDVISGREEARLIYQGVAHLLPQSDERRLVVDIGGRSTELIVGQQYETRLTESYRVGSVTWSMRYFPQGEFTPAAFERAEVAAEAVLDEAIGRYTHELWDVAYGASGTVGAVSDILGAAGFGPAITRAGLDWLRSRLLEARHADRLRLDALKDDRRPVIGGGLAVLRGVFDLLGLEQMHAAAGALRHGAVFDLLDREQGNSDVRSATVQRLAVKFGVDQVQARRVGLVSVHLLRQLRRGLDDPAGLARHERKLGWAAQLHEIGSHISHSDYHKHGAYILDHADAAGFALPELHRLGLLVLGHRGKLRKLEADFGDELFVHQLLCLRLAVILCHARRDPDLQGLALRPQPQGFLASLRPEWAAAYPQSAHLLREETVAWQKTPWTFTLA